MLPSLNAHSRLTILLPNEGGRLPNGSRPQVKPERVANMKDSFTRSKTPTPDQCQCRVAPPEVSHNTLSTQNCSQSSPPVNHMFMCMWCAVVVLLYVIGKRKHEFVWLNGTVGWLLSCDVVMLWFGVWQWCVIL